MKLNGKKIYFLGDSITEGAGASTPDKCFVSLFRAAHPEAEVFNVGIGGTRLAKQTTPSAKARYDLDFLLRSEEISADADVICVFGGTNDYGHGDAPMGCFGCKSNDTFWGALYALSVKLIEKCPTAHIVFFTPLHRDGEDVPAKKPDGYHVLSEYVDAVRKNAEYFSFPVLDLYACSGIQPAVPALRAAYTADGLHPNDRGYEKLFRIIDAFIEKLV